MILGLERTPIQLQYAIIHGACIPVALLNNVDVDVMELREADEAVGSGLGR
jgi:hypothetical protein